MAKKKYPPGMMAEKTIRGLLRNLTRQLSQKMPPDKALKLMEHQVRLEGQLRAIEKLRIEKELARRAQSGETAA